MPQPYAVDASRVLGWQSHHQRDEDGIQQMSMAGEPESQQVKLLGLGVRRQPQIRMHVMHGVCLQHFANVFVAMYSKMDLAAFNVVNASWNATLFFDTAPHTFFPFSLGRHNRDATRNTTAHCGGTLCIETLSAGSKLFRSIVYSGQYLDSRVEL